MKLLRFSRFALLSLLLPSAAPAAILRTPASVMADPQGQATIRIVVIAEGSPSTPQTEYLGGSGTCRLAVLDWFCHSTIAAGDSIVQQVPTMLCNPEVAGLFRVRMEFCDGEQDTSYTSVLPYSPAGAEAPRVASLVLRNHPNPVRGRTWFDFALPQAGRVTLRAYDVLGRLLTTLLDEERPAGTGSLEWDLADASGARLSPGVYVARIEASGRVVTRRIIVTP